MNQDQAVGMWEQLKGRMKKAWGELTDDDFQMADGSLDKLYGVIRERVGDTEEVIKVKLEKIHTERVEAAEGVVTAAESALYTAREYLKTARTQRRAARDQFAMKRKVNRKALREAKAGVRATPFAATVEPGTSQGRKRSKNDTTDELTQARDPSGKLLDGRAESELAYKRARAEGQKVLVASETGAPLSVAAFADALSKAENASSEVKSRAVKNV